MPDEEYESGLIITVEEMGSVAEVLGLGIPRSFALEAAGISKERYHNIQQLAREGEEPYKSWLEGCGQAEAQAKVNHLTKLAESPDWRCRDKLLQITHPELFSGADAEHEKTYNWMLNVIEEETNEETFERIVRRFASEDPGDEAPVAQAKPEEAELH